MIKQYLFINLFRALAAFWVLSGHCLIWGGWYGVPLPPPRLAVDLFMVISGFLMAANADARDGVEPLSVPVNRVRFWLRRFFRIAPVYYLSLAIIVILNHQFLAGYHALQTLNPSRWATSNVYDPTRIDYSVTNIFLHLSFLFGLHPTYSFSTFLPDWSLGLEMQFYFVFPFLILFLQRKGFVLRAMIIGLLTILLGNSIRRSVTYYEPSLLFFKLQYFIGGILLFHTLSANSNLYKKLVVIGCAVILILFGSRGDKELFVLPLLLLSMFLLGWLESYRRMPKWLGSFLNCRLLRFASDASYCVYLVHGFFIGAFGLAVVTNPRLLALSPPQRVLAMFLFVCASAYITAAAIRGLIELPGIRLGKYCITRLPSVDKSQSKSPNRYASVPR